MQHKLIAFIGGGNMAQAIILGLLKQGYPAEQIIVNDPNEEKRAFFSNLGVATSENNVESVIKAEVVLLAVKPQMMADVCLPLSAVDFSDVSSEDKVAIDMADFNPSSRNCCAVSLSPTCSKT